MHEAVTNTYTHTHSCCHIVQNRPYHIEKKLVAEEMAMRPRGGGGASSRRTTRSGVARPVYDDFTPESEWQQDDESHILRIYLPGA